MNLKKIIETNKNIEDKVLKVLEACKPYGVTLETECSITFCKLCGGVDDIHFPTISSGISHSKCVNVDKFKKISAFDKNSNLNTFENSKPQNAEEFKIIEKLKYYSDNFSGALCENVGLILTGEPGTGKTFYSNCVANNLNSKGYTVLSFNLSSYFEEIKKWNGAEERLLEAVKSCDLLIIDDLGSERLTEWSLEKLYNLIDGRYRVKKPILITTNLGSNIKSFLEFNGSNKIFDRLSESCEVLNFLWESRRTNIRKSKSFFDSNIK